MDEFGFDMKLKFLFTPSKKGLRLRISQERLYLPSGITLSSKPDGGQKLSNGIIGPKFRIVTEFASNDFYMLFYQSES